MEIGKAIEEEMDRARSMLPALVGRETRDLSAFQARSAVIESLSENFVDTIASPLFYLLVFAPLGLGVEAAIVFKAASTMDSMLGYKKPGLAEIGFVPARLDDLLNWIPARLSILPLALAMPHHAPATLSAAFKYHSVTPSPNSGWPMSAAAGALGIRLEKPGYYTILDSGRLPEAADIVKSLRLGTILQAHGILVNAGPYGSWIPSSDWFFNDKYGVLYDSAPHLMSIMMHILSDQITEVSARGD